MRVRLAFALSVLLAPVAFAAPSTCLQPSFTLGDQRALDALRVATEAACPCASFSKRGPYQRCARDVMDAAVASSALRGDCVKTAKAITKSASCGTTKSPCGRIRERDAAVDCKVSKASSCTDNGKFQRTACTGDTHCVDVVDWSAGTCLDPRDPGPFAPGFRTIQYTKDSAAHPGNPRVLDTAIWYPATAGSGPIDGASGGVVNAPLDGSGGPYPVVLFSHGSCGYPLQSTFMMPILASHGFIVVAPPHPGNTIFEFPNCSTGPALVDGVIERPQDMIYVLDQILAADGDSGSPFFGAVDESRIAMTGHSFGGLTTYLVTAIEPRIKVAVPMAPATFNTSTLSVPSLLFLGVIDGRVNNDSARAAYDRSTAPKLRLEVENAGHYAFSDLCFASADCNPPTTLTQDEAHAQVLRYVLPFLKVYLADDADWAPLLDAPTRPGLVYVDGR